MQCPKCKIITKRNEENITCSKCKSSFHLPCSGLTDEEVKTKKTEKVKWQCISCVSGSGKVQNSGSGNGADHEILDISKDISAKVNMLVTQMAEMNGKMTKMMEENEELKQEVASLKNRLNLADQRSRINNVEISNYPEESNENIREVVKDIFKAIGSNLQDMEIQAAHRVPSFNKPGPKNIVVQFTSRWTRATVLANSKKYRRTNKRNLVAKDIKPEKANTPIYISEHLSPAYKQLLKKAKQFANDNHFKFVWVREGRILLKKDEGERQTFNISSEEDLAKLK